MIRRTLHLEIYLKRDALMKNLSECNSESIISMTVENYDDFLADRRKLMAKIDDEILQGTIDYSIVLVNKTVRGEEDEIYGYKATNWENYRL